MDSRAIDEAADELRNLLWEEWGDFALAALALGLAFAAGSTYPPLVAPLLIGALAGFGRGLVAAWRRWDLLDRLALDRDAQAIRAVRSVAARSVTMARRRDGAEAIRVQLASPAPLVADRIEKNRSVLEALADELDDDQLLLDPVCAVTCERLLTDPSASPLLNETLPADDLRARVGWIRAGFRPRSTRPEYPNPVKTWQPGGPR